MRLSKNLIFLVLFVFVFGTATASTEPIFNSAKKEIKELIVKSDITGRVIDGDFDEPLEFATVSVYDVEDTFITGASTDSNGKFKITLADGKYNFKFEFLGYASMDTTISFNGNTDLSDIKLYNSATLIEGATVTAERTRVTLKLDKQIFDVGADITSQGEPLMRSSIMYQR